VPSPANTFSIDATSGTISWLNPQLQGEFNIAFKVTEWRNGIPVGWVTRDMQVTVVPCSNQTPDISAISDTCVEINSLLQFSVNASDPDVQDNLSMTALGEPFVIPNSATFISPSPGNPISGNFLWTPGCDEVRMQPYQVIFEVSDNAALDVPLVNVASTNILVVATAPQNPSATPNITAMDLVWDQSICSNATGYKIFRRVDPYGFTPSNCETGVPPYTGYVQIGSTGTVGDTSYTDAGPLNYGTEYCYMVVACFADGAQSYASVEFCALLNREAPVITNVTVDSTDPTTGAITVRWENALELDTIQYPGPYQFELFRSVSGTNSFGLINTSPTFPFLLHPDTSFVDTGLDTESNGYTYRVDLINTSGLRSSSGLAASMFLTVNPDDEKNLLGWTADVPWSNSSYDIYREDAPNTWVLIGTSTTNSYLDSSLVNGEEYCYYVESTGAYSDPVISAPLINESQEACGIPIDLTPPCPPSVSLLNECEIPLNTLTWNNPNNSCSSDNAGYNIYFSPFQDSALVLIQSLPSPDDTVITHTNGNSVAGCYAITAVDSSGNESAFSNIVCGENCPIYNLPNVFTPNGDDINDTFRPLNPYRGVDRINLRIFNRWGQLVFQTEDPAIGWSGAHQTEDGNVPDGVYFYLCDVYFLSLTGEEVIELTGSIQILDTGVQPSGN
jgi:gliding motility-associated-like protein